jgi:hypothetical protein
MVYKIFLLCFLPIFTTGADPNLFDHFQTQIMTDYITLLLNPSAFYQHLDSTKQNQLLAILLDQSLISGDQSKKLVEIIDGLPKNVMVILRRKSKKNLKFRWNFRS